jgi:hypothetical protein
MFNLTDNPELIFCTGFEDIPPNTFVSRGHCWWEKYEAWQAEGNTPGPAQSVAEVASIKIDTLNAACRTAIEAGFASAALGSLHAYPGKEHDQLNLIGQYTRAVATGHPQVFWCIDDAGVGDYRLHTADQLAQVMQDGGAYKEAQLIKAGTLKAQIEAIVAAGGTAAEIEEITW